MFEEGNRFYIFDTEMDIETDTDTQQAQRPRSYASLKLQPTNLSRHKGKV